MVTTQIKIAGLPLEPAEVKLLAELLDEIGDQVIAAETLLSRAAICRAAAGCRCYRTTRDRLRVYLGVHRRAACLRES